MEELDYLFQTILTISAIMFTFVLVRFHDNKQYNKEKKDKLDDFIKNIIIELEYNERILESKDGELNKYHYIRDYYFRSSLSSGLIHLVKNDDVQKLLPMIYHGLEMYKETPSRIRNNMTLQIQAGLSPKKSNMDEEVKNMDNMMIRIVKEIKFIVTELKKLTNNKNKKIVK